MLKEEDRIFKNLYNELGWEMDKALNRLENPIQQEITA